MFGYPLLSVTTRNVVFSVGSAALFVTAMTVSFMQNEVSSVRAELARLRTSIVDDAHQRQREGGSFVDETGIAIPTFGASPKALASIPYTGGDDKRDVSRTYGGKGDALHVGGFTMNDTQGQSPMLYEFLVKVINIKSLIDVGCGRGISTSWFATHGVDVLCVEGSHDAAKHSLVAQSQIVEHDFSRGPWWPDKTYDFAWSVEFLEHVSRKYMRNYIPVFKQSAIVLVTHSGWGGYHHVEVHPDYPPHNQHWWFRTRFEAHGFVFSQELTDLFRRVVGNGRKEDMTGQHLAVNSDVYINPRVAGMPSHSHLVGGPGCYHDSAFLYPCGGADSIAEELKPVWSGVSHDPAHEPAESKAMTTAFEKP